MEKHNKLLILFLVFVFLSTLFLNFILWCYDYSLVLFYLLFLFFIYIGFFLWYFKKLFTERSFIFNLSLSIFFSSLLLYLPYLIMLISGVPACLKGWDGFFIIYLISIQSIPLFISSIFLFFFFVKFSLEKNFFEGSNKILNTIIKFISLIFFLFSLSFQTFSYFDKVHLIGIINLFIHFFIFLVAIFSIFLAFFHFKNKIIILSSYSFISLLFLFNSLYILLFKKIYHLNFFLVSLGIFSIITPILYAIILVKLNSIYYSNQQKE